jgi:hypothetical protein
MRPLVSLDQDLFEVWQGRAADGVGGRTFGCDGCGLVMAGTATLPRISPPGPGQPNWVSPRSRTAKQAAGSLMPLEGKALAIASAVVNPAPVNGEPTLRHPLGPRTPEKGGVRLPR